MISKTVFDMRIAMRAAKMRRLGSNRFWFDIEKSAYHSKPTEKKNWQFQWSGGVVIMIKIQMK